MLTKLAKDPDKGDFAIILNNLVSLHTADKWNKIINKVWVFAQDVLQHSDCLSGHIGDLKAEEVL